jgi:hypothetical protein
MVNRNTLVVDALLVLVMSSSAAAQMAGSFRLGNDPYRQINNEPPRAYTRMAPTTDAYFRTPTNTDGQIGPPPPPDQVERLSDELGHHLKMNYKHDVPEYNRRYVHFRAVMDEWDKSPKGVDDTTQMTQWLRTSIKYSMPGSDDFLPPMPKVNPVDQLNESTHLTGTDDPFVDDPVQAAPM